jgi:chorismate mutase
MERKEQGNWYTQKDKPFVIAGPCSAESEAQLRKSILPIIDQVDYVRAGIWKPRTRPGNFEGAGTEGLQWIQRIRQEQPFKMATEVATPEHVEIALTHKVDLLWIGARTTVNPFAVSELSEALKGVDLPVLVKNPIHAELALWKGAIERLAKNGISRLGAIHRGFHSYQKTKYRNTPLWQIPLDLKSEFPDLPMICDPSHIGGDRSMIHDISQRALDLNYDGLMIETHFDPAQALSDPEQQVTPDVLLKILSSLKMRNADFSHSLNQDQLDIIREQIDLADQELLQAIGKRLDLVKHIGEFKKENNVAIFQISRWKDIFKTRQEWAHNMGLEEKFVTDLLRILHQQSVKKQTEVFNQKTTAQKTNE